LAYWARAVSVAKNATSVNGVVYWTSGGPGTFLPWPMDPGHLTVMTRMDSALDEFIFHLITSYAYVLVAIFVICLCGVWGWQIGRYVNG